MVKHFTSFMQRVFLLIEIIFMFAQDFTIKKILENAENILWKTFYNDTKCESLYSN